jgi:hypothetical protein
VMPELERVLVAAANRRRPRGLVREAGAAALVAAVAAAVVLLVTPPDGGDDGDAVVRPLAGGSELVGLMSVFGAEQGGASALGVSEDEFRDLGPSAPPETPQQPRDVGLVRRIEFPSATLQVWPVREAVCMEVAEHRRRAGASAGCHSLSELRRRGITSPGAAVPEPGADVPWLLTGFAANGVEQVSVVLRGGAMRTFAVRHNAYVVSLDQPTPPPTALRWRDPQGRARELPFPGASLQAGMGPPPPGR